MQHNNQNATSSLENALNNTGVAGGHQGAQAGNQTFNHGASTTGAGKTFSLSMLRQR